MDEDEKYMQRLMHMEATYQQRKASDYSRRAAVVDEVMTQANLLAAATSTRAHPAEIDLIASRLRTMVRILAAKVTDWN